MAPGDPPEGKNRKCKGKKKRGKNKNCNEKEQPNQVGQRKYEECMPKTSCGMGLKALTKEISTKKKYLLVKGGGGGKKGANTNGGSDYLVRKSRQEG